MSFFASDIADTRHWDKIRYENENRIVECHFCKRELSCKGMKLWQKEGAGEVFHLCPRCYKKAYKVMMDRRRSL